MSKVICSFPNCDKVISLLENRRTMCSDHQVQVILFKEAVRNWIDGRTFDQDLLAWALSREKQGSKTKELAALLELTVAEMWALLPRRKIHFAIINGVKVVPVEEIVRIIDFFKNTEEAKKSIKKEGYAVAGQKNRATSKDDEYGTTELAKMFKVRVSSVHRWIERGILLPHKSNGKGLIFKKSDICRFLKIACSGTETFKAETFAVIKKMVMRSKSFPLLIREIKREVSGVLGDNTLPEKDLIFALFHRKGCSSNQLREHLVDVYTGDLLGAVEKGIVNAKKQDGRRFFPFAEMTLALSLVRNWVALSEVKLDDLVSFDTFYSYVKEGHFGETRLNLSGHICINRSILPLVNKICHKIRAERKKIQLKALSKGWYKPAKLT